MMLFELWGATEAPRLAWPARPLGFLLLLFYLVLFLYLLYRYRAQFGRLSRRQWLATAVLALASLTVSQLFPLSLAADDQLAPLGTAQNPTATLVVFGAVPFLLAGLTLNPAAALIVGFSSGLGRALWQTHHLHDPFHYAFVALLASLWMQQNYTGRLHHGLRQPVVSGALSSLLTLPLIALATYAYAPAVYSQLNALDLALSTAGSNTLTLFLLLEGLLGGVVVTLLAIGLQWRPYQLEKRLLPTLLAPHSSPLAPSPQSRSLNRRLLDSFLAFSLVLIALLLTVGFRVVVDVSTGLVVSQMQSDAQSVSARIPDFQANRQNLLLQFSEDETLLSNDPAEQEQTLRQLYRTGTFYRRILLIDENNEIVAHYPHDSEAVQLTESERVAVVETLESSSASISPLRQVAGDETVISMVVPIVDERGRPQAALIGRVPGLALQDMIVGLQDTVGQGSGFIVDERNHIIAHPDAASLLTTWTPPQDTARRLDIGLNDGFGAAYEGRQANTNARELVYYQTGPNHDWTAVITVPYEVVLRLALDIGQPILYVLAAGMVGFAFYLGYLGRTITRPIHELMKASQVIAAGKLDDKIRQHGDDEIGQLGQSFAQMQAALKKRLEELDLLLKVGQNVSASLDIQEGMPIILRGAMTGTSAAGVRVLVINPSGRQPLTFGTGPADKVMTLFDRQMMNLTRQQGQLILCTPEEVRQTLELEAGRELPIKALVAIPLSTNDRFQGVFWVSYRQPHVFLETEIKLLNTLASQAAVLVESARLYATAEGGRRRLAAVLASTSDAVIVTDPTERILLINPAMERAFGLNGTDVRGLPVVDVIQSEKLVEALSNNSERTRNVEIPTSNGRTLYASASTIVSTDGQVLGRVAVLHDITYLKEVDDMKSDFVATVSHDLRSPLTFMRGYANMLPMVGDVSPKQQEYVTKILGGIEQMSNLIETLLDLGRIEAGVELVLTQFKVEELLHSIADELAQPAQSKGIHLAVKSAPGLPLLKCDQSLIRQAVSNLVNNAMKYAPNSGEVIMGGSLENGPHGPEIVICVQDNGPGISPQDQVRLFEKFYRVKQRASITEKGSGLGLALVKSIAERHDGRAWCVSEVGRGSTFYISLPLRPATRA
jgi:PAS domain S-box-containing protein